VAHKTTVKRGRVLRTTAQSVTYIATQDLQETTYKIEEYEMIALMHYIVQPVVFSNYEYKKAELSQRGCATVSLVETLKCSLGIIQGHRKWYRSKA